MMKSKIDKKSLKRKIYLIVLVTVILTIGLGYAYLNKYLYINATAVASKSIWDVHLEGTKSDKTIDDSTSKLTACSNTTTCSIVRQKATISEDKTSVNFTINFNKSGDYYEFYVDIVNSGTINVMLSSILTSDQIGVVASSGIYTAASRSYITSEVKYADDTPLSAKDLIKAGERKRVRVRITYRTQTGSNEDVNVNFSPKYVEADSTAKQVVLKLCKRADVATLHTETCNQTSSDNVDFCLGEHTKGTVIKYGNTSTTSGTLKSGDAFDCDVNGDGTYDSVKERFYYASDYFNTVSKSTVSSYATLIYYSNTAGGNPDNKSNFAYDSVDENWHGPRVGYQQLPSTTQWKNITLYQVTRQILNENKGNITAGTTSGATLPTFAYTGKAARFLTVQEVNTACGITVGKRNYGELKKCEYLMENTNYTVNGLTPGFWLETAMQSRDDYYWYIRGGNRDVDWHNASGAIYRGIRPAIDVPKSKMSY